MALPPEPVIAVPLRRRLSSGVSERSRDRRLARTPTSATAWALIAFFLLIAIFGPLVGSHDSLVRTNDQLAGALSPGPLLGTDALGRDELARLLAGGRPLIVTSVVSVAAAAVVGLLIGIVAGYAGGLIETVLMRAMDAVLSFPLVLFAIMLVAALGTGQRNLIIAIALAQVPVFARLVRALSSRETVREYVLAAQAAGFSTPRILFREILPNILGPVIVQATSVIAVAAGYASAFSYLGLGIQPPQPDWGLMVKEGQEFIFSNPLLAIAPGLLITVFVLACNFVGDDLSDTLDADRVMLR
jgi:ABC-type dipeptide/oligopeptide/nickel transport system permease subunit